MPATTVRNVAREKLEQGNLSLGVGIRMTRSVEIAKAMAVAGFDWLFLDMEHGVMSLEACAQISTAALDAGIAPIARVPNGEYAIATRALDNGALGIVMPHVDTAAEAREVVDRLKYPPVGHRSMGGTGPHYGLRSASSGEAASTLNAANLTIVMLETPTAIKNAAEIAAAWPASTTSRSCRAISRLARGSSSRARTAASSPPAPRSAPASCTSCTIRFARKRRCRPLTLTLSPLAERGSAL